MIRHRKHMGGRLQQPMGQLGKWVAAKHLKQRSKIITKITNNYKRVFGAMCQAKRFELQKLQTSQNRRIRAV